MKTSAYNLLPSTMYGTAVENYDGIATTFSGIPQKAAAYYSKDKSIQTVSWYLTNFIGYLTIEATLDENSDSDNYFPINVVGDGINPLSENDFANLEGNYTWVRATISNFGAGSTINKVSIGY